MNGKQVVYLILSILGVAVPWYFNVQFMSEVENASFVQFFVMAFEANAASASITVDIVIAGVAFFIWCIIEGRRLGMKHLWFYVVWGNLVAFASALPLFLLVREYYLEKAASE